MSWGYSHPELMGEPIRLHWLGWYSDTFALQRMGWQFAEQAIQSSYDDHHVLRMRHQDAQVVGQTQKFPYRRMLHNSMHLRGLQLDCNLSHRLIVQQMEMPQLEFEAVDTEPMWTDRRSYQHEVHMATYFRPVPEAPQEIFLKQASMDQILEFALEKQEPEQARIRQEMLKRKQLEEYNQANRVEAQLRLLTA